jgi:hypothetical protein
MMVGTVHSALKSKGLPGWLWGEVVAMAVYLLNRSPTKGVEGKSLFEGCYGKKLRVQHLRTFGCMVHVKDTTPNLRKLDDRSRPMVFISYEPGSKAYRAYNLVSKKVQVSHDMIFDEQAKWDWSSGGEHSEVFDNDTVTVEMVYSRGAPATKGHAGSLVSATPEGSVVGSLEPHSRSPSPVQVVAEGEGVIRPWSWPHRQ